MKLSYNWLKQYADFDWSSAELAERLMVAGIEVEGVDMTSGSCRCLLHHCRQTQIGLL